MQKSKSANSDNSEENNQFEVQQLTELQLSVSKEYQKNISRYNNLQKLETNFSFQIFQPVSLIISEITPSQYEHQKIKLVQNMDKLLKDSEILTKLEMKHFNRIHEEQQIIKNLEEKITNNYLFLRKSLNIQKNQDQTVDDQLDRLSKTIATLKGGVKQTLKHAKNDNTVLEQKYDDIINHPLYQKMKEELQRALMRFQNQRQALEEQITKQIQTKQKVINQNNVLRNQAQNNKLRIRSLETEVATSFNKVNELTQKLNQSLQSKKTLKNELNYVKYCGQNFQLEVKTSNKQFKLQFQSNSVKRTLDELQQFLENSYVLSVNYNKCNMEQQIKCDQKHYKSNNFQICTSAEKASQNENQYGGRRFTRAIGGMNSKMIGENITKARFTRTSNMVFKNWEGDCIRQCLVRPKLNRCSVRE